MVVDPAIFLKSMTYNTLVYIQISIDNPVNCAIIST